MPYRKAWIYVLVLLVLTFVAFWPGYFSKLTDKKLAHHYHAVSAVLWMILAIVQSWTVHNNRLAMHRKFALSIFLLFPFFLVAGMWVIHVEATTLEGDFASLEGKPYPVYAIPLKAGMSIGMLLISVELLLMLMILLFIPGDYAGSCFIGFAIGESLGAAVLRIGQ